jgi:DeoR/GlpR family transcriptional regulator of sugar metabolism
VIPVKRREEILNFIRKNKICTIEELAKRFSVSRVTIHRVLNELECEALVTKVHGGVRFTDQEAGIETRFGVRMKTHKSEKIEIARKALRYLHSGDTVFIDSSTTCYQLVHLLRSQEDLNITVISNGPLVSYELSQARHIGVISTGGELFQEVYTFAGDLTLEAIDKLQFNKVFVSAGAVTVDKGPMTTQSFLAVTKRRVMEKASEVNLLIDSSKFGRIAPKVIVPLDRISRIITDAGLPREIREQYEKLGVELVL